MTPCPETEIFRRPTVNLEKKYSYMYILRYEKTSETLKRIKPIWLSL